MKLKLFIVSAAFMLLCDAYSVNLDLLDMNRSGDLEIAKCQHTCIKQLHVINIRCLQDSECSACWNECTTSANDNSRPLYDRIIVRVEQIYRSSSLVQADLRWMSPSAESQCLVTWEVSGGGLMGNLLTDTSDVQLSLWPDTKYIVEVMCKNKVSGSLTKSIPLMLDTTDVKEKAETYSRSSNTADIISATEQMTTTGLDDMVTPSISQSHQPSNTEATTILVSTSPATEMTHAAMIPTHRHKQRKQKSSSASSTINLSLSKKYFPKNTIDMENNYPKLLHHVASAPITQTKSWSSHNHSVEITFALCILLSVFLVIIGIWSIKKKSRIQLQHPGDEKRLIATNNYNEANIANIAQTHFIYV